MDRQTRFISGIYDESIVIDDRYEPLDYNLIFSSIAKKSLH